MSNKEDAIKGIFTAIGFIKATAPFDIRDALISELSSAVNFIDATEHQHEEFKESWLSYFKKYYVKSTHAGYLPELFNHMAAGEVIARGIIQERFSQFSDELSAADSEHSTWLTDTVQAAATLNEDAGKLMRAAIDCHFHDGELENVRIEADRVITTAIRVLINLPRSERQRS
ncbi:hypothetical protein [Serratia fonticola]|uniref:hypothetical protein n=1 Tax=Serratia fonticola TaxID=47917 RepID=UPI000E0F7199|nr:hypothetical protein [Serratia fonticola]RDL25991.1 hypothetical protein DFO62_10578 [Serratia fonticola]